MIIPKHYENLNVLHENTMPNRAYYIPAAERMDQLAEDRTDSGRMQLLNGQWKFRYYDSIYDLKENFYEMEYPLEGYDTVEVPGMWQNYGYDLHQYTNVRYPFPFDPPFVPQENPCGTYIYEFDYQEDENAKRAYLNFEGVDSCFYVWINGIYVGYSQVSHSTSEFDVTDYLKNGTNKLAVLVLKWCDGSYMEDQDKFRMSGIFRDVYLLKRPQNFVFDYFITTTLQQDLATVKFDITPLKEELPVQIHIYDKDNQLVGSGTKVVEISNPHLWNAEDPYLYTVILETEQEVITEQLGLREICIKNNVVYINGVAVKFRGVNRHDSDPVTGFVISKEQMIKDLTLMKEHNVNAIRTSHYPNAPIFYQLCDKMGFYVIDEADHEAHGANDLYFPNKSWPVMMDRWNEPIADNPEYTESTVDRIQRCVHRDKNRPSVVIWSMGNESAYGCTFEAALKWTKEFDKTRLTHYEAARYRKMDRSYDYSNLDLHSRMYPALTEIHEYFENQPDKPYILCEYCHAMGNGPGDLEDYFEIIQKYDGFCGAFVWEWCDHAIYKGQAENGKDMYWYGGDHGEYPHDGNFCMDGLVYPNRKPHTGLLEFKNVNRPVRVVNYNQETGKLTLHNYKDFTDVKDCLKIKWEVTCDGTLISSGEIKEQEMISVRPHEEGTMTLKVEVPKAGKCYLKLSYLGTTPAGEEQVLGFDEILLNNQDGRNQVVKKLKEALKTAGDSLEVKEDDRYLVILGEKFSYTYNKFTGMFEKLLWNGKSLLTKPMELNVWRAPTDNDRNLKAEWIKACYHKAFSRGYETSWEQTEDGIKIRTTMSLIALTVQRMLELQTEWKISLDGKISLNMNAKRNMDFIMLPRFGLRMFLASDMNQVTYYGMGPMESYRDKHQASSHGIYSARVEELHEDYIRPQENGSHYDCDYVVVRGEEEKVTVVSDTAFSFNASIYTQEELTEKNHNYELVPCGSTVLCIDYAQNGIGSNSCGPQVLEKYRLDEEEFEFQVDMIFE